MFMLIGEHSGGPARPGMARARSCLAR
uniref:Uncharacterized protein n=1 Tax=Arundo donax TaxID=35708 RepID=A0A0A8ZNL9_ARUDO